MNAVFIGYLIIIIALAGYFSSVVRNRKDFVIGGKKIPGFALALSERAAGESSWLLLGLTGHAFVEGFGSIWVALGCVIGILFIWWVMAEPLRKISEETGATTIPSILYSRFPEHKYPIMFFSSLILIFFFLFYIAAQFHGAGKIFNIAFGLDETTGIIIATIIILLYTMLGGFMSVVAVDVFQAILMIITIFVLPIIALVYLSSQDIDFLASLAAAPPEISTLTHGYEGWAAFVFILSGLSWAFGYTGQPHLLARMIAMKDKKNVVQARRVATIWTIIAYAGIIITGLAGYVFAQNRIFSEQELQLLFKDVEKILPLMVNFLVIPFMVGLLLSGAVSAMMSTAASQLMVCSFNLSEDIIPLFLKKNREINVWVVRIIIILVGFLAFFTGITMTDTVYGLVSYAWSGIGSSFGPALLLLLFWKSFNGAGVIASLHSGLITTVIWKMFFVESTGISERLVSFIITLFVAFIVSVISNKLKQLQTSDEGNNV
ncbi:MAG: sodium/proline symporter [Bacteroidales bacterium]|nr:sodium/proline symporter [Bacteroidales bacterium]